MIRGKYSLVTGGLLLIVCLCGLVLASSRVVANNEIIDKVHIIVYESCTLSGVGANSHVATIHNGQYSGDSGSGYENGIGKTTLTVFCNDYNGFSIYAIGYTGDSYDSPDHTKLVGNTHAENAISTAVYSNGDTDSSWSMKLTKITDGAEAYIPANMSITNNFDNWHAVPDTYTQVAQYKAVSGSSVTDDVLGGKLETTYATYISTTQAADTYAGKVKYILVHPYSDVPILPETIATSGCITYYPNGNDVEGTMGCQAIGDSDTGATLLASNYSREGYGFAGWSTTYDYSDPTGFYGPQEHIDFEAGTYTGDNDGLALYARWIRSAGTMQGWNACATIPAGGVTALTDQRDGETYAVAKLADGNCWMIENMRLEAENSTNIALAQGFGRSTTYGNFVGLANAESENFADTNPPTANSKYSATADGDKVVIGTSNDPQNRIPRYNNFNNKANSADRPQYPASNMDVNATTGAGMYSYGNYYNWAAAIANTGYYYTRTTDADGYTPSEAAKTSICPLGWMLPYGRSVGKGAVSGGLSYLDIQLGGTGITASSGTDPTGETMSRRWRAYPNNFVYAGYYLGLSAINRGSGGLYWASTALDSATAYGLGISEANSYPNGSNIKVRGYSLRCLVLSGE